jgi:phosphoribosyl 1,2-cyclic phosphate phosphodiesterase
MKITVLGCGSSGGVPLIGNEWGNCDPEEPRNRRTRVSIIVEDAGETILVDSSPDMRQQLLDCDLKTLSAVIFTHSHADHCHGIDDLRSINWLTKKPVDVYADPVTMKELEERFDYVVRPAKHFHKPGIVPHLIDGSFAIGGARVQPFMQNHGHVHSLGLRFGDFAYSTDAKELDEAAFVALEGIKVWIVDATREEPHPTHAHLEQTLGWIARVKPERAYLTHMNHMMDYASIAAKLPPGVWPAHDGLVIEC